VTDGPQDGEGTTILERLRRRKVVQWGIAYAAGAWGFLQGLAYVSELLQWPAQLQKLTGLALLIGLPLVLVIAWYHGDRGERRVTRTELAILTLLFLLGGGLFWRYQHTTDSPTPTAATGSVKSGAPAAAVAGPSIAVLPFENRSSRTDDAFFVDGIHDDILTQLSKISALKVISRTSVEQFRDTKLPIKNIAEQLGVKSILEGGVQRAGERVRINVQLIDASTDAHLWAEAYDRELTAAEIFAIQSEVAEAIAGALKAALTQGEKARVDTIPTQNLQAWEAYQLGKQRLAKRTSDSLAGAERFFRKATDLDPEFALAYAGLADTLRLQIEYSGKPVENTLVEADRAISRALDLDEDLAEAWTSKGGIALSREQWAESEKMLRRAIELNPNYATAHHWLSLVLRGGDRPEDEIKHAERAAELDPLSVIVRTNFCNSLEAAQRYDEAAACLGRAIEIDPASPLAYRSLANLDAYARNRFADAVTLGEHAAALDAGNPDSYVSLLAFHLDMGDVPRARQLAATLVERWPDSFYSNIAAAVTEHLFGSGTVAGRYASKVLTELPQNAFALRILRDADLSRGDTKTARARYARAFPEFFEQTSPRMDETNFNAAVDLSLVLQKSGELERATRLLEASERVIRRLPRLGEIGYGVADVQSHALRADKDRAIAALREAERAGWRGVLWRYYRDIDPSLTSIRDEPEFKAVFADIERDMARQRAELAARRKDSPLDLAGAD
jgi:TolB-like protein/Tfp pilus assembly protein PilF